MCACEFSFSFVSNILCPGFVRFLFNRHLQAAIIGVGWMALVHKTLVAFS